VSLGDAQLISEGKPHHCPSPHHSHEECGVDRGDRWRRLLAAKFNGATGERLSRMRS
jgi:hypothetical protein